MYASRHDDVHNDYDQELQYQVTQPLTETFAKCVRRRVDLFLEYDYPESKDLAKSFLTLVSGLLLASIAFSEKIVDFARASWVSKSLMVACWISFLGAIVACGAGLAFMVQAGVWAIHHPFQDYWLFESRAEILFLTAGLAFGTGLATLLTAGIISIVHRPAGTAG